MGSQSPDYAQTVRTSIEGSKRLKIANFRLKLRNHADGNIRWIRIYDIKTGTVADSIKQIHSDKLHGNPNPRVFGISQAVDELMSSDRTW